MGFQNILSDLFKFCQSRPLKIQLSSKFRKDQISLIRPFQYKMATLVKCAWERDLCRKFPTRNSIWNYISFVSVDSDALKITPKIKDHIHKTKIHKFFCIFRSYYNEIFKTKSAFWRKYHNKLMLPSIKK